MDANAMALYADEPVASSRMVQSSQTQASMAAPMGTQTMPNPVIRTPLNVASVTPTPMEGPIPIQPLNAAAPEFKAQAEAPETFPTKTQLIWGGGILGGLVIIVVTLWAIFK